MEKIKEENISKMRDFEIHQEKILSHKEKIIPPQQLPSYYRNTNFEKQNYLSQNDFTLMNENII